MQNILLFATNSRGKQHCVPLMSPEPNVLEEFGFIFRVLPKY